MPRTILFLAWAPFFSGAERALVLTLKSLDPARYRAVVLSGTDGEFAAQVRNLGVPCEIVPIRYAEWRHPVAALRSIGAIVGAARRHNASLLHSNDVPSFQPGGYAASLLRIPAITHIRFPDSRTGYKWFLRDRFALALFVSDGLRRYAVEEAPDVFAKRSVVLHDGVQPQETWSPEQKAACRRELGLPVDATIVALTGQISEVKGIWDFVDAANLVVSRRGAPLFVVLGDDLKTKGAMRRAMEEKVAALGLTGSFRFLGFRNDAPRVVQAFDIIAVPSLVEPLGNATLEAMAAGRPVIGSRVGGIPEMIVDGVTGRLVAAASPAELAAAIQALSADKLLMTRMSEAARVRARDAFGIPAHGAALQTYYDRLHQQS